LLNKKKIRNAIIEADNAAIASVKANPEMALLEKVL
jgi:hypothetical protein